MYHGFEVSNPFGTSSSIRDKMDFATWQNSYDSHGSIDDPLYINAEAYNFHLSSNSPASNAGMGGDYSAVIGAYITGDEIIGPSDGTTPAIGNARYTLNKFNNLSVNVTSKKACFIIPATVTGLYSINIYTVNGRCIWSHNGNKKQNNIQSVVWDKKTLNGSAASNSAYLTVLTTHGSFKAKQRFVLK
jgi:hypothetical protein